MKDQQAIFACDIGGSKLLCGLVKVNGEILDTEKVPLPPDITTVFLENKLTELYQTLLSRNPGVHPIASGMTVPGVADSVTGTWVYACFSGISDYPIAERMQQKLNLPVTVANDVNACAWAELHFGTCRDKQDFLWVTVSNGVGGGLILDGKIYEGFRGGAGEFGHLIVEEGGDLCPCGHHGCMEAMAAGPAITKRYERLTGKMLSATQIATLPREGDTDALSVMKKTGEYIGRGLGKVASILNLRRYVLGGGVMQSWDLMEKDIKRSFSDQAFTRPNIQVEILPTALNYEAGLLGAASLILFPHG